MLIDWFTVAAQIVNFLILIWLLKRFLYQRILDAVDQREQRIAAQLADAAQQRAAAGQQQTDLAAQQEQLADERAALLQTARQGAEAERQQLLEQARQQAAQLHATYQQQWQQEQQSRELELQQHVRQQVFQLGEQLLHDLADEPLQARMLAQLLRRLPELPPADQTRLRASAQLAIHSALPLDDANRAQLHTALQALNPDQPLTLDFQLDPNCLCGLEIHLPGYKLAWHANDYLLARIKPFEDAT